MYSAHLCHLYLHAPSQLVFSQRNHCHVCIELQHMASFVSRLFLALSHLWDSSMLCLGFSFLCSIPLYEYTTIHLFYFICIELNIPIINLQAIITPYNHFTSQQLLLWKRKILIWAIWETLFYLNRDIIHVRV